mgnify:FL=1
MEEKKNINIEESMNRLENIAQKISDPSINLEESLKLYDEAKDLINKIETFLKEAKEKIN